MSRMPHCSFCGKNQEQVAKLIAAPGVYICDECVGLACEILAEEGPATFRWAPITAPPTAWPDTTKTTTFRRPTA